ncbi:MAG: hypothetical protein F6J93_01955 [Oscillatoria sp. SIO1A7]|nr:hypothetical protein [Oscillatoria sp. SIO1A7]
MFSIESTKLKVVLGILLGGAILGWGSAMRAEDAKEIFQQVEAGNCQGSTEVTYRSQQLRSPDGNSLAYYNATLRRVGRRGDRQGGSYCQPLMGRETPVRELVVESGTNTRRISLDPTNDAYVISNPISFSPDSRYIVIERDMAGNGGAGATIYNVLDSQNGYRRLSVSPCRNAFYGVYKGFVSASEILFSCTLGRGSSSWEVVDLRRGSTREVSQQYVNSAGKPQSYGTVVSELTVVKKQVFPRR